MGISVRTGEYSVRGRKTADAASDRQSKEIDEFEEEDFLKEIISEIGIVKNNGLKIEEYETTICGKETFREIYGEYEKSEMKSERSILMTCFCCVVICL